MKKLFFLLFIIPAFILNGQVRFYDVQNMNNYQQILQKALQEDKLMFIAFYKNGDGFYQMQKDDVFSNARLDSLYQRTVPMAIGITSEMGSRLAESIGVDSFPTFYYFNNEETLLLLKEGYQQVDELTKALTRAEELNTAYNELRDKYTKGNLTQKEWRTLIGIYALNNDFIETTALALEFFNSQNSGQLLIPENAALLQKYGIDLESPYPSLIIENKAKLGGNFDFESFYSAAYDYNFDLAVANNDTVLLERIVEKLLPNRPEDDANTREMAFETRKVFASETQLFQVWKKAALERSTSLGDDSTQAEFLFAEAFEIADNFNSEEAKMEARNLAASAYDLKNDFRYKMLEAYMAYLLKDFEKARTLVQLAETKTDNANNKRKAQSLSKMIEKEIATNDMHKKQDSQTNK